MQIGAHFREYKGRFSAYYLETPSIFMCFELIGGIPPFIFAILKAIFELRGVFPFIIDHEEGI
jgi:hypothetical protein